MTEFSSYFPWHTKDTTATATLSFTAKSIELLNSWYKELLLKQESDPDYITKITETKKKPDASAAEESFTQGLKDISRGGINYNGSTYKLPIDFLSNDSISLVKKHIMLHLFHQSVAANFLPLIKEGDEILGQLTRRSHEPLNDLFTFQFSDIENGEINPDKLFFKIHGNLFFMSSHIPMDKLESEILPKIHLDGHITINLTATDGQINISAETGHISITGKDWPSKAMMRAVNKQLLEKIGNLLIDDGFADNSIILSCSDIIETDKDRPLKLIQCSVEDIQDYIISLRQAEENIKL